MTESDKMALAEVLEAGKSLTTALEGFHFREALKEAMNMARTGNRYLQETEPWKIAKGGEMERVGTILNTALQICASIAVAFEPFLPFMSDKLCKMLGMCNLSWSMVGKAENLSAGVKLGEPELLFEKIEDEAIQAQIDKLNAAKEANKLNSWKAASQAPDVDFDTFMKADLRVGTVLECERVPKADKLLRFLIDDGLETRTIVSGIAAHYAPETLVGKQVVFIANLPPRKLRGIVSQGMILSAENADGSLILLTPMAPATPGAQVK